ncbi:hypothetical protein E4U42_005550 [Claviceps africana]|uniref:Signal recognition particle subunit SRP72 n=1 Tax=Claviceps africana TaxID=83212 RepID=A0A8K0J4J0_9HYPO|nr:hypothetical protein E4U42_005550 [Claviceps africana]
MPQDPAIALAALLRAASVDDHSEILKAANATLNINETDELAQHTRVVALLKLDRFDDASRAISGGGFKLQSSCALEKAYALYKLGKLDEAVAAIDSTGLDNRGLNHMAAQIAYRAERFDASHSIYNRLLSSTYHEEDHDIKINIKAAEAQAHWKGTTTLHGFESRGFESFELCYNAACNNIARGYLSVALELLQRALALCDASDELNSEEKADERKPILAQQALTLAKLGNIDGARKIHQSLKPELNSDADLRIILQNNHSMLESMDQNPFSLEWKTGTWLSSSTEAQLFNFQSQLLSTNSSIISMLAHKICGVKKRAFRAVPQFRSASSSVELINKSVIGAAAETQGLPGKDVLKNLIRLSKRRPHDVGLALIIIQLHLRRRNLGAATYTLDSFFSRLEASNNEKCHRLRFNPGLIALAVVLKKIKKRESSAKVELVEAGRYWLQRPAPRALSLLKEAGAELVSSSSNDDLILAGTIFETLNEENLASPATSAGLVAALACANLSAVERHAAVLPSTDSLVHGIQVNELISSGVLVSPRTPAPKKRLSCNDKSVERATKKRRRKLPKILVGSQAPDPERWLPLRDRSSYRPKGKKGRRKASELTQGGLAKDEETIGLVGGGGVKIEKAAAFNASKKKKKAKK